MKSWFLLFAFLGSLLSLAQAHAQGPALPSPSAFHQYDLGTTYTITAAHYDYYQMLAERSPRVAYAEYGRSLQGRPLPMLFVSSAENIAARADIQRRIRALTQVTTPLDEASLQTMLADLPGVVWIFIVDTDEEAGVEVLQEVAHALATREDPEARAIRDNLLVIITPLTNPDSHARYVTWHKLYDVDGAAEDPNAIENRAHWGMNTDGNAYGIDVNRDFGWFVSPEMQAFGRIVMQWRPQLFLDIHSGPTVIFLPPFPPPYHGLWPDEAPKWWNLVARQAGDNFGRKGWSFNTREGYEGVTSVGFGLSWGMLGPAVSSFLFETFGGRPARTTAFRRTDGTLATMRMAMDRHAEGIWAVLQVAHQHREELLRDAHAVVVEAVAEAQANPVRTVLLPAEGPGIDPAKVERLVERLRLQEIGVERAQEAFTTTVASFFDPSAAQARTFPAGTYLIDFVQPQARLARALLDPTLEETNPQVLAPNTRRMPYYDTTWHLLPLLFGVPAYAAASSVNVTREMVTDLPAQEGHVVTLNREGLPYAYILPAGREASYRIAIQLMREGYNLRVFKSWFQIGERRYPKGTWAAIRRRNPDGLHERLHTLAEAHTGEVIEVAGPFTDAGVAFGDDRNLAAVPMPRVAVVADWPVNQDHTYGGIRTTLEADFGFSFSPIMLQTLNEQDLSPYTTVVLPHAGMDIRGGPGFSNGYRGLLNMDRLRAYVRGGGTLIAVQGAAAVIAEDEVLGRDVAFNGWAEHTNGAILRAQWTIRPEPETETVAWEPGLSRLGLPLLASGYPASDWAAPAAYPVLLDVQEEGSARVLGRYTPDATRLLLDGFMLDDDRDNVAGRPFVIVQPVGSGRVIYFADDPTFRGHWYGLNTLFLNSLILGPVD